ncbi:MAG: NAD(P)-dependent oxidoreductase [Patescibacteria group bacterium]
MVKIAFFEIEDWEVDYVKNRLSNADFFFSKEKLNKDNLPEILRQNSGLTDFDAISVFVGSEVKKEVIDSFPNLKLITTRSTGFDHIDLKIAKEKNIKTGYVPGYGDNTVAEFAFGLLLNLSRKIYEAFDKIRERADFSFDGLQGFDLNGKTIGIVGTGRIGRYSIKIAKGFGMNVIASDVYPNKELEKEIGFKYVPFEELLANSDVITLHIPYSESNHYLINSKNIAKMKKGAVLINTARGPLVETEALIKALNEGQIGGYGTDVLEEEGIIKDEKTFLLHGNPEGHNLKTVLASHVLIDMPNIIITPHNAFNTKEALQRILDTDIENIKSYLEKGETKYSISPV